MSTPYSLLISRLSLSSYSLTPSCQTRRSLSVMLLGGWDGLHMEIPSLRTALISCSTLELVSFSLVLIISRILPIIISYSPPERAQLVAVHQSKPYTLQMFQNSFDLCQ